MGKIIISCSSNLYAQILIFAICTCTERAEIRWRQIWIIMHRHADKSKLIDIIAKPPSYLSTFFQSKLRLMTTGGAPGVASGGGIVPDRQGEVNTQHRPSAKSEEARLKGSKTLLTSLQTKTEQKSCCVICINHSHTLLLRQKHKSNLWRGWVEPYWPRISALLQQITLTLFTCVCMSGQYQARILYLISCLFQKRSVRAGNIQRVVHW